MVASPMKMVLRGLTVCGLAFATAGLPPTPTAAVADAPPARAGMDFNGDGFADLAVGAPFEAHQATRAAGSVNVLYGSSRGLSAAGDDYWSQASSGIKGSPELDDRFGSAIAGADFNGDGRDELVVGVPGEGVGGLPAAGAVHVLRGGTSGLSAVGDQLWTQGSPGVPGALESHDNFGASLSTGHFNGDRYADLAVGSPNESLASVRNAGSVTILYGSSTGLRASNSVIFSQGGTPLDRIGPDNRFGRELAAGDTDADGYDDLAIGAPGAPNDLKESFAGAKHGKVRILFGSAQGLTTQRAQAWSQDSAGVAEAPEPNDQFGAALSFGLFNGDNRADLAIGAPGEALGSCGGKAGPEPCSSQGVVHVLYGSRAGLTGTGSDFWHKSGGGLPGTASVNDGLGLTLTAGNFDGSGPWDLVIYSAHVRYGDSAGTVTVVPGSARGLVATGSTSWTLDSPGISGPSMRNDRFGSELAVGRFAGGRHDALVAGAPGSAVSGTSGGGSIRVLYGTANGMSATRSQAWSQASAGVRGALEAGDCFGNVDGSGDCFRTIAARPEPPTAP